MRRLGSVVEHVLGKNEVTGPIPVVGSDLRFSSLDEVLKSKTLCKVSDLRINHKSNKFLQTNLTNLIPIVIFGSSDDFEHSEKELAHSNSRLKQTKYQIVQKIFPPLTMPLHF